MEMVDVSITQIYRDTRVLYYLEEDECLNLWFIKISSVSQTHGHGMAKLKKNQNILESRVKWHFKLYLIAVKEQIWKMFDWCWKKFIWWNRKFLHLTEQG